MLLSHFRAAASIPTIPGSFIHTSKYFAASCFGICVLWDRHFSWKAPTEIHSMLSGEHSPIRRNCSGNTRTSGLSMCCCIPLMLITSCAALKGMLFGKAGLQIPTCSQNYPAWKPTLLLLIIFWNDPFCIVVICLPKVTFGSVSPVTQEEERLLLPPALPATGPAVCTVLVAARLCKAQSGVEGTLCIPFAIFYSVFLQNVYQHLLAAYL